jgi:hypothetical protein
MRSWHLLFEISLCLPYVFYRYFDLLYAGWIFWLVDAAFLSKPFDIIFSIWNYHGVASEGLHTAGSAAMLSPIQIIQLYQNEAAATPPAHTKEQHV